MLDRIPTPGQEGRVLVTPEDGGAPFYAKIQMADNPTQDGDPFAKFTMLHDDVAAAYDKNALAVPNDIFAVLSRFHKGMGNEYVWARFVQTSEAHYEIEVSTSSLTYQLQPSNYLNYNYGTGVSVDESGNLSLTGIFEPANEPSGNFVTYWKVIFVFFVESGEGVETATCFFVFFLS